MHTQLLVSITMLSMLYCVKIQCFSNQCLIYYALWYNEVKTAFTKLIF